MNTDERIKKESGVGEDIYTFPKSYALKFTILCCTILFLGFACHVSITPRVVQMAASKISQNKICPLYYDKISFSLITLSLRMKNIHISGTCWGNSNDSLDLKRITISPGFPGIWPLGLKLNMNLEGSSSLIRTSFLWGIKKVLYIRKKSHLSSQVINSILGRGNVLAGKLYMMGELELKGNNINAAHLVLQSKHFNLLPKTVRVGALPFTLPALKIAPIMFEGNLAKKRFEITSFRLGHAGKNSLFIDFKGSLSLNRRLNRIKDVELLGDLKIAKELLDGPLSILNLLWDIGRKPQRNGIYQIKFSGSFPKALTSPEFIQ